MLTDTSKFPVSAETYHCPPSASVGWNDGDGCLTTRLPGRCGGRNTYAPDYLIEGKSLLEWYLGVVLKLAIRVLLKQKLAPTHHNKTSL